jgi:Fic family protein
MKFQQTDSRAGRFVKQPSGYHAFIPAPLPPDPPIAMDSEIQRLLSDADRALGRLDGITTVLPNPDLFVAMYVRQEAVLSSQIEGTQSTMEDILHYEVEAGGDHLPKDVSEVSNYVKAINYGLQRLKDFPLSLRLIREIHEQLLEGVRGQHQKPGEFRKSQNWIGPGGCTLADAVFIPPPPSELIPALSDLEGFLHSTSDLPALIHCGLAHAQFETIHPFLDGNGRVGRLLITFLLCERNILQRPLLYLSHYFKLHRVEYYDRLMATRMSADWEGWLKFFLRGVFEVSLEAANTSRSIIQLREEHQSLIRNAFGSSPGMALELLDHLFFFPVTTPRRAESLLKCSYVTASKLIRLMESHGLLQETTGGQRNRVYHYQPYLDLFLLREEGPQSEDGEESEVQATEN